MQKLLLLFMTLSLFQISLFAKEIYIKTMTVDQRYSEKPINELKDAGYDVRVDEYKKFYRVYVGPFNDLKSAKSTLKKIKSTIAKDAFITSLESKKRKVTPKKVQQVTQVPKSTQKTPKRTNKKKIFIKAMTIDKEELPQTLQNIHENGYENTYIVNYKNFARVYIGPYENLSEAKVALRDVKTSVSRDAFITKIKVKGELPKPVAHAKKSKPQQQQQRVVEVQEKREVIQKRREPIVEKRERVKVQKTKPLRVEKSQPTKRSRRENAFRKTDDTTNSNLFIGVTAGAGKLNISQEGNLALDIDLKDDVISLGVEGGYYLGKNSFITLSYQYSDLEDLYLHNIYTSLNYQMDEAFYFSPYIGILAGFNILDWKNYPLDTIVSIDPSFSYLFGLTVGTDIEISKSVLFYLNYKYWLSDYSFTLATSTSSNEITVTGEQNVNFGLKFKF